MFSVIAIVGLVMLSALTLALILGAVKNRDGSSWGMVSFFFPPAVLLLLFLPKVPGPRRKRPTWHDEERRDYARDGS